MFGAPVGNDADMFWCNAFADKDIVHIPSDGDYYIGLSVCPVEQSLAQFIFSGIAPTQSCGDGIFRKDVISEQYEAELSRGEALISYIGMNGLKYMDVSMEGLELEAEDQIVLCSDGFYRQCPEENLAQCLENLSGDYETYASQLAEAVIRNQPRGMDNTTLILVRYSPEENEEKIREVNEENEKGDIKT